MDSNDLFGQMVRENTSKEVLILPPSLDYKINDTLSRLPDRKNKFGRIRKIQVAAAAIVLISLFGATVPSYAKTAPIFQEILKYLNIGSDYENIVDEFGISETSNGLKVTIDNAIYDGYRLLVLYHVQSDKTLIEKPRINVNALITGRQGITSLFSHKTIASFSNEYGQFTDKDNKVYTGAVTFRVASDSFDPPQDPTNIKQTVIDEHQIDASKIPATFTVSLDIPKLAGLEGKWNFDLTVTSEKAKGNVHVISVNKDLSNLFPNTKLEKVIETPIGVYLQGTLSTGNEAFGYIMVNDKQQMLKEMDGGEVITYNQYGRYVFIFENLQNAKSLTLIPYIGKKSNIMPRIPLNLSGETKIPLGSNHELTITRAEEKNGKTFVYFSSQSPFEPFFYLTDDSGKLYVRDRGKSVISLNGGESVFVYNEPLLSRNLKVVMDNIIYYNDAFTINLKQ